MNKDVYIYLLDLISVGLFVYFNVRLFVC